MSYYLLDNPPASRQFYPSRNTGMTGGVIVHTTEGVGGDDSAENTAGFISRRSDAGSYHCLVDTNSTVLMVPDSYTVFGVSASGYNSRCWMIAIAARSADLDADNPLTQIEVDRAGAEIAAFWLRNGFNPFECARWIGEGTKSGPGLACHGDVQSWDRSDAWSRHPQRERLDQMLVEAICRHAGGQAPAPAPAQQIRPTHVTTRQRIINGAGCGPIAEDGIEGPQTRAGTACWQRKLNIAPDGVWGPQTQAATDRFFEWLAAQPATPAPAPAPAVDLSGIAAAIDNAKRLTLTQGSTGDPVKWLQLLLNNKGANLVADGVFGPATRAAVRTFQASNGLAVDAVVGPRTWSALTR